MMGGFYTHISDVTTGLGVGSDVKRGDVLGKVYLAAGTQGAHLHLALVEIVGGAPGGRYMGVNLYEHFKAKANSNTVSSITFKQDGSPPIIT